MKKSAFLKLGAALATVIIVAGYAAADFPSIVCSFRMSGTAVPYARGIYTNSYATPGGIFYEGPGRHSLRVFTSGGSPVATYPMPGGVMLGDADRAPEGYSGYFAVVDEGAHELKAYTTTGSYGGVIRTLPSDVVAYACGGHVVDYLYLGTTDGKVFRYTPTWSLLNSFWTGLPTADLAAGCGYDGMWGDWVVLGPSQPPADLAAYRGSSGAFYSSFALAGNSSRGALCVGGGTYIWCLRDLGTDIWAYELYTGPLMAVAPASLGRVKALFR
jgi:hypothetical protein